MICKDMTYTIKVSKSVQKFLKKAPPHIKSRFLEKAGYMKKDPFDPRCDIIKLINTESDWRLRVGDYRFFFTIMDQDITIYFYEAGARGDIYK